MDIKEAGKKALLVVDVQTAIVVEQLYKSKELIANIKELITQCRNNNIEVIYVRHDSGEGSGLHKGDKGWAIYGEVAPADGEKIVDKNYNSAFRKTELKEYLEQRGISTLILTGLQTDYCMDATCKVAFEYGYDVIVPEGTTSTFSNEFMKAEDIVRYYVNSMWDNRYAKVQSMEEVVKSCS